MIQRRLAQIVSAILYNNKLISDFPAKYINSQYCVPGLNCRHCPASVAGCPLFFMQKLFSRGIQDLPVKILCWLLLLALAFGRLICGWLCPLGLVQDLLDKIPTTKIQRSEVTRRLSYLKYFILAVFVVVLPIFATTIGLRSRSPFCSFACPNITFSNIVLTMTTGGALRPYMIYGSRFVVLVTILVLAVFLFRPFCRFLCPLGAFYGFFNKYALLSIKVDEAKCVHCNACMRVCKMDIKKVGDRECISCGDCKAACKFDAIHFGWERKRNS